LSKFAIIKYGLSSENPPADLRT